MQAIETKELLLGFCTHHCIPVPKQAELGDVMALKKGERQEGTAWVQAGMRQCCDLAALTPPD